MKYIKQLLIIILFSLAGEALASLIPLPVPAAIYGLILLLIALMTGCLKAKAIADTARFGIGIMPILFVAPVVNLMDCWDQIKANWLAMVLIVVISTLVTFGVSGMVTQWVINRRKAGGENV